MRVTFLLVAFLAGAHSFKAVERRAKPMGKGGGGVVARSVVEAAIQALAVDDKIAARHAVNRVRAVARPILAGAAVVMAGGIGVGFVLGLLYASQRRRPVPATLYRVASKEVDAKGLADLALAEVV